MNRTLFTLRVIVKDGERAILTRNGRFERALEPGRHTLFDSKRELAVELCIRSCAPSFRPSGLPCSRRRGPISLRSCSSRSRPRATRSLS